MIILGLHTGHDGAACIVENGRLTAALASERISRQRKSHGVTKELIDTVMRTAGVSLDTIDAVALSDYHPEYTHGAIEVRNRDTGNIAPLAWNQIFDNDIWQYDVIIEGRKFPGYHVGHHMSHCAAAYYTSPFEHAYCMSMDASGGEVKSNFLIAKGEGKTLGALETPALCSGIAYGFFTEWVGVGPQMFKAGSTMALASYGKPLQTVESQMARHIEDSFFRDGQGNHYRNWMDNLWEEISGTNRKHWSKAESESDHGRNVCASIQKIFEESILHCAKYVIPGGSENLCLGGGSFLNCVANGRLKRESGFKNVHIFPACSDDGCAVGAALYVANMIFDEPRYRSYHHGELAYLGPDYEEKDINDTEYERIASKITDGGIVAWVDGRSEFGPRALGARSMLADPRDANLPARINAAELKNREWYRPVCPSVLESQAHFWFDERGCSPYMLIASQTTEERTHIPGVVHHDGTARQQTVSVNDAPRFRELIRAFYAQTGIPMLANTSLNKPGRPIIETEEEALEYFHNYPVDMLVLHGEIYEK